jgi:RNA polymerase sigma-70 factor, ECF subfamily
MEKTPKNDASAGLDRQISENLRRVFEEDPKRKMPDRLMELIEIIRRQDQPGDHSEEQLRSDIIAHLPRLTWFARSLTKNASAAEDLVQDTALKALSNLDKFKPGTNLRAWLFTILRNQFYSTKRKGKWEVEDAEGAQAARLVQLPDQEPRMALQEFRAAFLGLPDDQREALFLVGVSGFSYEEAAETCGCAIGTVKSRVNRGRAKLSAALDIDKGTPIETDAIALGALAQSRAS